MWRPGWSHEFLFELAARAACGAPATRVCGLCYQEMERDCWYCEGCASKHQCSDPGTDYFLPVVNSPRVGLCAYTGPEGP